VRSNIFVIGTKDGIDTRYKTKEIKKENKKTAKNTFEIVLKIIQPRAD
jgi:hypothetical protein